MKAVIVTRDFNPVEVTITFVERWEIQSLRDTLADESHSTALYLVLDQLLKQK